MSTVLSPVVSEFEMQEAADAYDAWVSFKGAEKHRQPTAENCTR